MTTQRDADYPGEHVVYRLFDKHDELIYIGMTRDINERLQHHRNAFINPWALHVDHWTAESHPTRVAARAAEQAAIAEAQPPLNKNHNAGRNSGAREDYFKRYAAKEPPPDRDAAAELEALFTRKRSA